MANKTMGGKLFFTCQEHQSGQYWEAKLTMI